MAMAGTRIALNAKQKAVIPILIILICDTHRFNPIHISKEVS